MEQKDIDQITEKILALNTDKEKLHEFTCALANAKAMIENKLASEMMKSSIMITMKKLHPMMTRE